MRKNKEWYFSVASTAYGTEEMGDYDSEQEAREATDRVRKMAKKLKDGVKRFYTEPYQK